MEWKNYLLRISFSRLKLAANVLFTLSYTVPIPFRTDFTHISFTTASVSRSPQSAISDYTALIVTTLSMKK